MGRTGDLAGRVAGRRVCFECGATYHLVIAPPHQEGRCDLCGGGLALRPEEDQPEKRFLRRHLYETLTAPVCAFYQERGLLREIDAAGLPEVVYNKICESLSGLI